MENKPSTGASDNVKLFTRAFILVSMINFSSFVGWQMALQGLPVCIDNLGGSSVAVGLCTTLAMVSSVVVRPIAGAVADRYGRKGLLFGGFAFMAAMMAVCVVFPFVSIILIMRITYGIGWGFGSTGTATIAADIIPRKRFAEGMGWFSLANSMALAVGPALAIWLLDMGAVDVMLACIVVVTLVAIAIGAALFRSGYVQPELKRGNLRDTLRLRNMFDKTAVFPAGVMGVLSMGFGAVSSFIVLMADERGVTGVALYFVAYAITNVIVRPVSGKFIDRYGYYVPGIFSCLMFAVSLVVMANATTTLVFVVAGVLVGLGLGTGMGVFQSMAVSIAEPSSRGAATSTFFILFNGGMAFGAFVAGAIAEVAGYTITFEAMAGCAVLACVLFLMGGKERIDEYHAKKMR